MTGRTDRNLRKYLERYGDVRPIEGPALIDRTFSAAVVIPALAESQHLRATLESLAETSSPDRSRTVIVVIVNNSLPPGEKEDRHGYMQTVEDNTATLRLLNDCAGELPLNLVWIDAATPGRELPPDTGVGMARKIGCDSILYEIYRDPPSSTAVPCADTFCLAHLDADTLVAPNYLMVLQRTVTSGSRTSAVVPFAHQKPIDAAHREAIAAYELYMRYYVEGLAYARSPYAFHTLGSAMACTARAYVQVRGIPRRRTAGEDFYFLQNLAKNGSIVTASETTVYPSARLSARVPFGTGQNVSMQLKGDPEEKTVYHPAVFETLRHMLETVASRSAEGAESILAALADPAARDFLAEAGFVTVWQKLERQHAPERVPLTAFYRWFDGLATLRLVRYLTRRVVPEMRLRNAWKMLGEMAGLRVPNPVGIPLDELLEWCRQHQRKTPPRGLFAAVD
ncbi:MAG: glycosyltransferase family 2 protein [Candidatus Pacebacteria bacterium]|nr:glycosyltransferase family 2 protein [Candidatus Paceibacterota bacterium]